LRFIIAACMALSTLAMIFAALVIQYLVLQHRIPWEASLVPLVGAAIVPIVVFISLIKSDLRALRSATLVPTILVFAIALRFGASRIDETLSARPVANALATFDSHHLPVAVFLTSRETEFGLAFYLDQAISNYQLRQIPAGEHIVVASQGFQKSIAKESARKVTYLGNFASQKLEYFYVAAR
jgi:hypothetical protein